jgi:hypothetical protein
MNDYQETAEKSAESPDNADRRAALRRLGRFAAVTAPAVTLLLAVKARPANAQVRTLPPDDVNPV